MRLPHALLVSAVAGALVLPGAAAAATPAAAGHGPSGPVQRVTLVLTPQDRGALRDLAAHHGRAGRAALTAALPSARTRDLVRSVAAGLGLHVDRVTPLTVEVSARASLVRSVFGSARAVNPHSAVAHPLPHLPSALRGRVSAVFGGDESRPAFHRLTDLGTTLRTEYGVATALPATAPGAAVATVQLSDWNAADLGHYATDLGGPAPQLTELNDSGYPAVLSPADSVEVDLDQEAIYAVAPTARQRLYKSDNQLGGMYDSLIHIGDDALDGVDDNIVAASISWGFCEQSIGTDSAAVQLFNAFEDAFSYVLASGVTVFAASGDDGTKCDPDGPSGPAPAITDVSYPASSPQVIAVGGTAGGAGSGNPRTSWDDTGAGSGGGVSAIFTRPTWQTAASLIPGGRSVPDIAALAGAPGFDVYSSTAGGSPGYGNVNGTSLASPLSAALFATAMATAGAHPYGIGNVLPELYAASSGFTDVTASGDGGGNGGPAADAGPGYDQSTGLGIPAWDTLVGGLAGTPHVTPGSGGTSARYFTSTTIPYTVTKSMRAVGDAQATYRIDDVTFTNPSCTISAGLAPRGTAATFTDTYDVTNGDPTYVAGSGDYDGDYTLAVIEHDASGACRIGLRNATVDTLKPSVSAATVKLTTGTSAAVTASWGGTDELSGVKSFDVHLYRFAPGQTSGTEIVTKLGTGTHSLTFTGSAGYGYLLKVYARDNAGNVSTYRYSNKLWVPVDSSAFTKYGTWATSRIASDYGGSALGSSVTGAKLRRSQAGKSYTLWFRTGPSMGKAGVYVGNTLVKTVNLYASSTHYRVPVTVYSSTASGTRTITVSVLGQRDSRSHGTSVFVDALVAAT